MIIFGFDLAKAPWLMIGYILVSISALVYGTNYVNTLNSVRGVVFGLGFCLVLLYFGIRWFGSRIPQLKSWPPVINTCPDYLTYITIPLTGGATKTGCIDMLGVTISSAASHIKKTDSSTAAGFKNGQVPDDLHLFQYTSADIKSAKNATDIQRICQRCQDMGITWEGVYDGDTCLGISSSANSRAAVEQCLLSV